MAKFLKITGWEGHAIGGVKPRHRWIGIDTIDEIVPDERPTRYYDSAGKKVKAKDGELADEDGWLLVYRCEIAVHGEHPPGSTKVSHGRFHVDCDAESLVAEIEALLAPPPAPAEDELTLNDRDVWWPGESYQTLDLVKHPEDVSKTFLALQPSKSTSALVLANSTFWCRIHLPAGGGK